jgi:predicted DNA-binding transcriptional regulator AlpA
MSTTAVKPLLRIRDVAEILTISRSSAYDLVNKEQLGIRVGERSLRVDEDVLRQWITSRPHTGEAT